MVQLLHRELMTKRDYAIRANRAFQSLMLCIKNLKLGKPKSIYGLTGERLYNQHVWWTPEWYEEKKTPY